MATNRLYLFDWEDGSYCLFAKALNGWHLSVGPTAETDPHAIMDTLNDWLRNRDGYGASGGRASIVLLDEADLKEASDMRERIKSY